jgi:uncharacterized protein YdiU (UPF0061 family)
MKSIIKTTLNSLKWEKTFVDQLPGDVVTDNYVRQVKGACYSFTKPQIFPSPSIVIMSMSVCQLLNMSPSIISSPDFLSLFSGQRQVDDINSWSCCYAGHQFGSWAGQLGDGRAITIGELRNEDGRLFDIQLKGSGRTPYSRHADGKAVLRSCIREFLASEAMHHLGIPTTRAMGVFLTGEKVVRDILYDGNPAPEPGSMMVRVSESLVRFGSFELLSWQKKPELIIQLLDYVIQRNFKHLNELKGPEKYLEWFKIVTRSTAQLVAKWQGVGFVHGVMNTDNMSVLGETIDYGPFGFLEEMESGWTPNTTDNDTKRYTYENQPDVALWNLAMLGNALLPVVESTDKIRDILKQFKEIYDASHTEIFKRKLGFYKIGNDECRPLVKDLMSLIESSKMDMTIFFRKFADFDIFEFEEGQLDPFVKSISDSVYDLGNLASNFNGWSRFLMAYKSALVHEASDFGSRRAIMSSVNPKYILRNWQLQECVIEAEQGRYEMLRDMEEFIQTPFSEQPHFEKYFKKRPDWAKRLPGYSMLSCSS